MNWHGFKKKDNLEKLFEVCDDIYVEDLEGPLTPCTISGPKGERYVIGKYKGLAVKVPVDRRRNQDNITSQGGNM